MRRSIIKNAKKESKRFLLEQQKQGHNSKIYKSCKFVLRNSNFIINYDTMFKCLDNIDFIYDSVHRHWAETDGKSISINIYKNYTLKLLTNTFIHEVLHYNIVRDTGHEISELKEHRIMELVNPLLI